MKSSICAKQQHTIIVKSHRWSRYLQDWIKCGIALRNLRQKEPLYDILAIIKLSKRKARKLIDASKLSMPIPV